MKAQPTNTWLWASYCGKKSESCPWIDTNVHGIQWFNRHTTATSVSLNVFVLALQNASVDDIQNGHQGLIFDEKLTRLPIDHHSDHKIGPVVFILCENVIKFKDMPYR
jgi:hypothetical protein